MASRYHEVYDGWKRDPEAFWAEAAEDIDWFTPLDRSSMQKPASMAAGSTAPPATPASTPSTAMWQAAAPTRSR